MEMYNNKNQLKIINKQDTLQIVLLQVSETKQLNNDENEIIFLAIFNHCHDIKGDDVDGVRQIVFNTARVKSKSRFFNIYFIYFVFDFDFFFGELDRPKEDK
jgi:hypothetical protein